MSIIDRLAGFAHRRMWLFTGMAVAAVVGLSAGAWGTGGAATPPVGTASPAAEPALLLSMARRATATAWLLASACMAK